jgi:hypothetical protein
VPDIPVTKTLAIWQRYVSVVSYAQRLVCLRTSLLTPMALWHNDEMSPSRLNLSQRVVLVVGSGVAVYFLGAWITSLGSHLITGWTGYAPLSSAFVPYQGGLHPWVQLVIWLILVLVWTGSSLALLKSSTPRESDRRE